MKTLRLIGMGLFAVLMSFTIASCGDDEEDDPSSENPNKPDSNTDKKLVQVKVEDYEQGDGLHVDYFKLEYDNQGRVISSIEYEDDGTLGGDGYKINYSGGSIVCTEQDEDPNILTFIVADGKIVVGNEEAPYFSYSHSYNYNSYNYLTEIRGELGQTTFTWSENKLMEVKENIEDDEDHYYFEYDGKTCKGYNPAIIISFAEIMYEEDDILPFIAANPELIGFKTNHLPKRAIVGDEYVNFTYELDDNGYLKRYIEVENNGEDYKAYTFFWE